MGSVSWVLPVASSVCSPIFLLFKFSLDDDDDDDFELLVADDMVDDDDDIDEVLSSF